MTERLKSEWRLSEEQIIRCQQHTHTHTNTTVAEVIHGACEVTEWHTAESCLWHKQYDIYIL